MPFSPSLTATISCVLLLTTACATPSAQHATQSAGHSAHAASHGASALATGTASVAAVPITAAGTVLEVSGAALADAGAGSIALGNTLYQSGTGAPITPAVPPNAPPTLD